MSCLDFKPDVCCLDFNPDDKPWCFYMKQYLKSQEYEISKNDKRRLRRLASNLLLNGDVLYKRNHDKILLRCVEVKEAKLILE